MAEIQRFWRSYHSIRWAGDRLVMRLRHAPTDDELADLNERFGDLLARRRASSASDPLPAEVADQDDLDLPRLVMRYDARRAGRLRSLIDAVNDLPSAAGLRSAQAVEVVGLPQDPDGLLDGPASSSQASLVDGQLVPAGVDALLQPLDGEVGQLLGDGLAADRGCRRTPLPSRAR